MRDTTAYEIETDRADVLEDAIKQKMAQALPLAVCEQGSDHWERKYRQLAQQLAQLLDQKGRESRVRIIDYPTKRASRCHNTVMNTERHDCIAHKVTHPRWDPENAMMEEGR